MEGDKAKKKRLKEENTKLRRAIIELVDSEPSNCPFLIIPEPGFFKAGADDILPGGYTRNEVVGLIRKHKRNPDAIQFIADMLEE